MKMSKKRQQEVYRAIHEEITRLRIRCQRALAGGNVFCSSLDLDLAQSTDKIHERIKKVLDIQ